MNIVKSVCDEISVVINKLKRDILTKQDASTAVNYENLTNCITEIPQDIKLELSNGTLTLKAGSKLYIPNGFESDGTTKKFDAITMESDMSYSTVYTSAVKCYAIYNYSAKTLVMIASVDNRLSYDSATNKVIHTALTNSVLSFPFALVVRDTTGIGSVDQIFNGFGYIDNTVYALPGVKGLIPNGRNADGSLKNIEFTLDKVTAKTFSYTGNVEFFITRNLDIIDSSINYRYYNEERNLYIRNDTSNPLLLFGVGTETSGKITSFTPKTVFHALDYNDKSTISGWSMPSSRYINLSLAASGSTYTAPANGWFMLNKVSGISNNQSYIVLVNRKTNIKSQTVVYNYSSSILSAYLPIQKGDVVEILYNSTGEVKEFRFIYAEGEPYNSVSSSGHTIRVETEEEVEPAV